MTETSTERFLRIMNEQNSAVYASEQQRLSEIPSPDLIRLEREQARRKKFGILRARKKSRKRSNKDINYFK